jgi:hypothetical protein
MEYLDIIPKEVYRIGEGVVGGDCGITVAWASLAGISLREVGKWLSNLRLPNGAGWRIINFQ